MKKRIACLLLAIVMLVGLIPAGTITVSAASEAFSASGIKVIKAYKGFKSAAYEQPAGSGNYLIGYGTPGVKGQTISEAKADLALREALNALESDITGFASANSMELVQKQYDALLWYSYVYGIGWTSDPDFCNTLAKKSMATSSEIVNAFCAWDYTAGFPNTESHVKRIHNRMAMANLYVNGVYSSSDTGTFGYTVFDAVKGDFSGERYMVQAFDTKQLTKIQLSSDPARAGFEFLGWYKLSGEDTYALVNGLGSATNGKTLYARYQEGSNKVAVSYRLPAEVIYRARGLATDETLIVYAHADDTSDKVDVIKREETISVAAEKLVGSDKWLQLATGGWILMGPIADVPTFVSNVTVTVTDDVLNIRADASVTAAKVGVAKRGDKLTVFMTVEQGGIEWGYCSKGWIALMYTDYFDVIKSGNTGSGSGSSGAVVATGTVNCGSALNVRKSPNTTSSRVGTLKTGTRVQILETTTTAGHKWGRISTGWICMDYVVLDSTPVANNTSSTTVSGSGIPGVVVNTERVNVRAGAGVSQKLVTTLMQGTNVTVYEQKTVDGAKWGRIDQGWVCLDYVKLDQTVSNPAVGNTGTVSSSVNLNVRSGPGTEYAKVSSLTPGTTVVISQKQTVKGVTWGKIDQGWIDLSYVSLSAASTVNGIGGTVVNCSSGVNIRSAAGTTSALVGVAPVGSRVVVTERTQVKGVYWGHIDRGWVCMDYIQLDSEWTDPVVNETPAPAPDNNTATVFAGYPGVLTAESPMYADASSDSKVVLTLKDTAKVSILARKIVGEKLFGKVAVGSTIGWIDMANVSLDTLYAKVTASKADAYEKPNTRSTFYASLPQGKSLVITEQSFDGTYVWGKTEVDVGGVLHTAWINLNTVTMYPENAEPQGIPVNNGVGYLTGKIAAETEVYKDFYGYENLSTTTPYTLVVGHRVNILTRTYLPGSGETMGKISIGSTVGWINMADVILDPVQQKVTAKTMKAYDSDFTTELDSLEKGDIVTITERSVQPYANGINDWGKIYVNDDPTDVRYIVLDEGKLANVTNAPSDNAPSTTVLSGVVVIGTASADMSIYEEADDAANELLKIKSGTDIKVLNWKLAGGKTWGKVQIGSIIGWVKIDEVDFSTLTGVAAVSELNVYGKADKGSSVQVLRVKDKTITVNQIVFDGSVLWGNIDVADKNGWVDLADMKLNTVGGNTSAKAIATGKINSVDKNITVKDAPDGSDGLVAIPKNTKVNLIDVVLVGDTAWWLVDLGSADKNGWVNMDCIAMNSVVATINCKSLDIVDDLAVQDPIETLYRNEKITVTLFKMYGDCLYGEVEYGDTTGWILLINDANEAFVTMAPGAVSNSNTSTQPTAPAPTQPIVPSEPAASDPIPATVVCANTVNVRSGAGVTYTLVTTLKNGTSIRVYEQTTVNGKGWARIDQGWICTDYVTFGTGSTGSNTTGGTPSIMTSVPAGAIAVGYANEDIKIRSGAGMGYDVVATVKKNASIVIYERKLEGGMSWGRTDNGWLCISYMTMTAIGGSSGSMGTIANCGFTTNVRGTAGINGALIAKVMVSSRVAIYETTVVSGESWGRTDLGWINMMYVALDASAPSYGDISANEVG